MNAFSKYHPSPAGRRKLLSLSLTTILSLAIVGVVAGQSGSAPSEPPDAAAGLSVHAERCANCHGAQGLGDGELAAGLPNPPAAHAAPEYIREAVPAEMFDLVTNGRVEKGMPPFGPASSNPLVDRERWDVIAAIYSLGTPLESVEQGGLVYEENCQACHGEDGRGEGPDATGSDAPGVDLADPAYWSNISNQSLFEILDDPGRIAAHDYVLAEEELWQVIDFARTYGYHYTDALAAFRPLESAAVGGQVRNGTTGENVGSEATVHLRAFTQDLQTTLTMSQTADAEGNYFFELSDVPQDWFFRVSVDYGGLDFGSDFAQLTFDEPEATLPVIVYEKSDDPSAVNIQQLHLILSFAEDSVVVSELYVASNIDPTVFAGTTGDPKQGTFEFSVPEGAVDLSFQRGFGNIDSFIPANEIVATENGWADTLPLRTGLGSLNMLVQYALPYDGGATIEHALNYPAETVSLVLPDVGVALDEADGWLNTGRQTMETGSFDTFAQSALPAGSTLTLSLDGNARAAPSSANSLIRDNSTELIIGAGAALLVIGLAAFTVRRWRSEPDPEMSRDEMLQAIAELDAEFEAGAISESEYISEREWLKEALLEVWDEEEA
jgi:mono/diheme cytochrome c family protein